MNLPNTTDMIKLMKYYKKEAEQARLDEYIHLNSPLSLLKVGKSVSLPLRTPRVPFSFDAGLTLHRSCAFYHVLRNSARKS